MSLATLAAYTLACFIIIIVPGPTVTVIIANSLRDGARAGLLNVAGTQAGLVPMVLAIAAGLHAVAAFLAEWFYWIKFAGALYLLWLGIKLWRSTGDIGEASAVRRPASGYFWQGFVVILANPKALLFLGAFLPQFVDPAGNTFLQTVALGAIFMATAAIFDSAYAFAAGGARSFVTRARIRLLEKISGTVLIAGGVWLATLRRT
jgi:threonine/homoserine/homoserine lactone efflux protein